MLQSWIFYVTWASLVGVTLVSLALWCRQAFESDADRYDLSMNYSLMAYAIVTSLAISEFSNFIYIGPSGQIPDSNGRAIYDLENRIDLIEDEIKNIERATILPSNNFVAHINVSDRNALTPLAWLLLATSFIGTVGFFISIARWPQWKSLWIGIGSVSILSGGTFMAFNLEKMIERIEISGNFHLGTNSQIDYQKMEDILKRTTSSINTSYLTVNGQYIRLTEDIISKLNLLIEILIVGGKATSVTYLGDVGPFPSGISCGKKMQKDLEIDVGWKSRDNQSDLSFDEWLLNNKSRMEKAHFLVLIGGSDYLSDSQLSRGISIAKSNLGYVRADCVRSILVNLLGPASVAGDKIFVLSGAGTRSGPSRGDAMVSIFLVE